MQKKAPTISRYMTPTPHAIEPTQSLTLALQRMEEFGCHHLPVRVAGKVVGILSDKDIAFLMGFPGINLQEFSVKDAMTPYPYVVNPNEPLEHVVSTMRQQRCSSAVVVNEHQELLGIFTATDALTALHDILRTEQSRS